MAIPKKLEDILDRNFPMGNPMDNTELEAWLAFLGSAVHVAYTQAAEKKFVAEKAVNNVDITKAKEFLMMDDNEFSNVTSKKLALEANEKLIAAQEAAINAERERRLAEALVEMVKERSAAIRKIATIRANTIQFSENSNYSARRGQDSQQPPQQPIQQPTAPYMPPNVQNSQSYTPPDWSQQQPPSQGGQQPFFAPQQ